MMSECQRIHSGTAISSIHNAQCVRASAPLCRCKYATRRIYYYYLYCYERTVYIFKVRAADTNMLHPVFRCCIVVNGFGCRHLVDTSAMRSRACVRVCR